MSRRCVHATRRRRWRCDVDDFRTDNSADAETATADNRTVDGGCGVGNDDGGDEEEEEVEEE